MNLKWVRSVRRRAQVGQASFDSDRAHGMRGCNKDQMISMKVELWAITKDHNLKQKRYLATRIFSNFERRTLAPCQTIPGEFISLYLVGDKLQYLMKPSGSNKRVAA